MPKSQFIQIRVSEEEKREWQEIAKDHGITLAEWIRVSCQMAKPIQRGHSLIHPDDLEKLRDLKAPLNFAGELMSPFIYPKVEDVRVDPKAPVVKRPGVYPKHPASRIKRGRPKTSERLRSMREGK